MAHTTDATDSTLNTASAKTAYQVHRSDLPLSCPTPEQKLWNSHPRVYLPIEKTGTAICPYCSAVYTLVD
ncbi:MAG TPA: zinc-finger domain-containing protein [Xanthomonadales bacterium]|nr:zinc-finger domain-containing protein [Xanthomonadales bacterium]